MNSTLPNSHQTFPRVSQHAIDRFISRSGTSRQLEKVEFKLERMLARSKEVYKKNATLSLLNNRGKEARYFLCANWILVVVDGVMTTCYQPNLKDFKNG